MAIFTGARSFATFDSEELRLLLGALDPEYHIPGVDKIVDSILPRCYVRVKDEAYQRIAKCPFLNVSIDESTDIRNRRVLNISVSDSTRSYFIGLRDLAGEATTAENLAEWVISELRDLACGDFSRINSITTDTCSTMHSLWRILASRQETKDVFFLGSDSHGLQLLIKDIISLPSVSKVFKSAQAIVAHFNNAPMQLAILRYFQLREYKEERALLGSIITRWGTQYLMLQSIKDNEIALTKYVREHECRDEIKVVLRSMDFWDTVSQILYILKPIHEAIKASESVASHAGYVLQRWFDAMRHLEACSMSKEFGDDLTHYMASKFHDRMRRQVQDLHWAAYYLNPLRTTDTMPGTLQALLQFSQFRNSTGEFFEAKSWSFKERPQHFWEVQKSMAGASSELAGLALRLFHTTTTSTASERAFSAQNRQLTLSRNRMTTAHTDMATFIYLNARSLRETPEIDDNNVGLVQEDNLMSSWGQMPRILEDQEQLENEAACRQVSLAAQAYLPAKA
ncbi:similar to zinc finger, BED-type containing 4 [Talaromyces islandicus]|uniref:Similar to zinc finger, BED-type containing 4 n=1 Tax=Talaromyces islandicus TaxID=28573 RepID=A0A0U1LNW1_TALIS|nr:similar to zinc finger, BED-type containing 4 [Talaromyces islandicus]